MHKLTVTDLGRAAYQPALDLQLRLVERVRVGADPDSIGYLLLVEHDPPVLTLGRRGNAGDILAPPERLAAAGVEVHRTTRGGEVTWHGPGQLVGYPILPLRRLGLTLREYVNRLEETLIRLLERFEIDATRIDGITGVWVGDRKIAAIGVAVAKWITCHGFALNVSPDLAMFDLIVPCGMPDASVTSMSKHLGREISMSRVKDELITCFAETFGFEIVTAPPPG